MNLSEKERVILHAIEHQPLVTLDELNEKTGYEPHVIRYQLKRFQSQGILEHYRPYVDLFQMGFVEYELYFSLNTANSASKIQITSDLVTYSEVTWLAELGGQYHFALGIMVKHISELTLFLEKLSNKWGSLFRDKALVAIPQAVNFGRNYLNPQAPHMMELLAGGECSNIELDALDSKLLKSLILEDYKSFNELSKMTEIPFATLERRRKRLEEVRIINGYFYQINSALYGMHNYKICLSLAGISSRLKSDVYNFAREMDEIVLLYEAIGVWDYEFVVEVSDHTKILEMIDLMHARFGRDIINVFSVPVFAYHKRENFPFCSSER